MIDAQDDFDSKAGAAESLALICASDLAWETNSFAGWEAFDVHRDFGKGMLGIAQAAIANLSAKQAIFETVYQPCLSQLDGLELPSKVAGPEMFTAWNDLDEAVSSMKGLLQLSTQCRKNSSSFFIAKVAWEELEESFTELFNAAADLRNAAAKVRDQAIAAA